MIALTHPIPEPQLEPLACRLRLPGQPVRIRLIDRLDRADVLSVDDMVPAPVIVIRFDAPEAEKELRACSVAARIENSADLENDERGEQVLVCREPRAARPVVSGMGFAAPSQLTVSGYRQLVQLGLHVHSIADERGQPCERRPSPAPPGP